MCPSFLKGLTHMELSSLQTQRVRSHASAAKEVSAFWRPLPDWRLVLVLHLHHFLPVPSLAVAD